MRVQISTIKVACWNIYMSHRLITGTRASLRFNSKELKRTENVVNIINAIDADILGIVECMPKEKLEFFCERFFPHYQSLVKGTGYSLNLGLLYNPDIVRADAVNFNEGPWMDCLGNDPRMKSYRFSRVPLIVEVTHLKSGNQFILSLVHTKSKKTYKKDTVEEQEEALNNRKKIVSECKHIREILFSKVQQNGTPHDQFLIMGDINDGPGFDQYEAKILYSGVESLIGSVLDPDRILYSFINLSDGGLPTTSFEGAPQLDHMFVTQSMIRNTGFPKLRRDSGRIRSDLVNLKIDGKHRDSDHAPVELLLEI